MSARRTYWHLEHQRRVPSEYDIATAKLLYRVPGGSFEVPTAAGEWQRARELACELRAADWDLFRDPRETTYARYVELQKEKEAFVDGLFKSMEATGYDRSLSEPWVAALGALLPVLRYPCHALQMTAAFLGQTAPSSSVVVACAFQTADEIRRIERVAYRMRQLQEFEPTFGQESKRAWQSDAAWQPLRRLLETLLVTYDFGEAFVASNLVIKPVFDELVTLGLGRLAERSGDVLLGKLLFSLGEDATWHREWSRALVAFAVESRPQNRAPVESWALSWAARTGEAARSLAPLFGDPELSLIEELEGRRSELWRSAGLFGGCAG